MLSREDAVAVIKEAYAARVRGDKEALGRYWADGAHFEIAGDRSLVSGVKLHAETPMAAISSLIDRFAFSDLEPLETVVEGNKVAVLWRVTVTTDGRNPETTRIFDLFTLDDDGKIRSLVQFADTALIRHMVS